VEVPQFCVVRIRDAWLSIPMSKPDTSCIHRIDRDRLTVDVLENDPHFIATWEATPFHRTS
jgi:hypothetical protein